MMQHLALEILTDAGDTVFVSRMRDGGVFLTTIDSDNGRSVTVLLDPDAVADLMDALKDA